MKIRLHCSILFLTTCMLLIAHCDSLLGLKLELMHWIETIDKCFSLANTKVKVDRDKFECYLKDAGFTVSREEKVSDKSALRSVRSDPKVREREKLQETIQIAMEMILEDNRDSSTCNSAECVFEHMKDHKMRGTHCKKAVSECQKSIITPKCDRNSKYRTADGSCNNLQHPTWGSSLACFRRLFDPHYEGLNNFRKSVQGCDLPLPRTVSRKVHSYMNRTSRAINHLFMMFGQMLDHDITFTPTSTTVDNEALMCCPLGENKHPQCCPIIIPPNDPFYSKFNVTCVNMVRSSICPTCNFEYRRQVNLQTACIDGSHIYGWTNNATYALRANDGTGMLLIQKSKHGSLMPRTMDPATDQCSYPETGDYCFRAGDPRVNENTGLTCIHTLWLRQHNRIAKKLAEINPCWDGDTLFQEARRIIGAEIQAVAFQEYLPYVLGPAYMDKFDLTITDERTTYDPDLNPTLYTEFSTAAYRIGHSWIHSVLGTDWPNGESMRTKYCFFNPFSLYDGQMDSLFSSTAKTPSQILDRYMTSDVTNHLYRTRNSLYGQDLASFNIQRGRDHGLCPYVIAAEFCHPNDIHIGKFEDLFKYKLMTKDNAMLLKKTYQNVRDVDLWTGILCETDVPGGHVGNTGACIIARQFHRLKFGDRFFFTHCDQRGSFNDAQLKTIKETTFFDTLCGNLKIKKLPTNVLFFANETNPLKSCNSANELDLSAWTDDSCFDL